MDTVRFGLIGCGGMGSFHVGYFPQVANAKLTAVCDTDPAKLQAAGRRSGAKEFSDYQQLLDSGLVDAVLIATPHYFHPPIAREAFAKGLHVLSEKPVAVSAGEARKTNDIYLEKYSHLKYAVMYQMRTNPFFRKLREMVAAGELGSITRITWIMTAWYRTWSYYASGGWRATWNGEGGGVLLNQNPHNLDQLQWIVGMSPRRVTAITNIAKTHPIEVEDEVSAILEYDNGAMGHFVTSSGEAPGTDRLEICGDRGKLVLENGRLRFVRTRQSVSEHLRTCPDGFAVPECWEMELQPLRDVPEGHQTITQNFVNAILRGEELIAPGIEGVRGLEIGNAMTMAGITRKAVELPLDGPAYEAFLQQMIREYGGKKKLTPPAAQAVAADLNASFR